MVDISRLHEIGSMDNSKFCSRSIKGLCPLLQRVIKRAALAAAPYYRSRECFLRLVNKSIIKEMKIIEPVQAYAIGVLPVSTAT